jgi:hypothetical protein
VSSASSGPARRAVAILLLVALVAAPAVALAACGGHGDPFTGLWWEPSTGRRIEIRLEDGRYWLYYGAARRPYAATRTGDELRIREPLGEDIVVRRGDGGRLRLVIGGRVTRLERVPQDR